VSRPNLRQHGNRWTPRRGTKLIVIQPHDLPLRSQHHAIRNPNPQTTIQNPEPTSPLTGLASPKALSRIDTPVPSVRGSRAFAGGAATSAGVTGLGSTEPDGAAAVVVEAVAVGAIVELEGKAAGGTVEVEAEESIVIAGYVRPKVVLSLVSCSKDKDNCGCRWKIKDKEA
jgi:hypothetical protein